MVRKFLLVSLSTGLSVVSSTLFDGVSPIKSKSYFRDGVVDSPVGGAYLTEFDGELSYGNGFLEDPIKEEEKYPTRDSSGRGSFSSIPNDAVYPSVTDTPFKNKRPMFRQRPSQQIAESDDDELNSSTELYGSKQIPVSESKRSSGLLFTEPVRSSSGISSCPSNLPTNLEHPEVVLRYLDQLRIAGSNVMGLSGPAAAGSSESWGSPSRTGTTRLGSLGESMDIRFVNENGEEVVESRTFAFFAEGSGTYVYRLGTKYVAKVWTNRSSKLAFVKSRFDNEILVMKAINGLLEFPKIFPIVGDMAEATIVSEYLGDTVKLVWEGIVNKEELVLRTLRLGIDALMLLKQLHSMGFVHGDIHPSNFVLNPTNQKVYLIDYGKAALFVNPLKYGWPHIEQKHEGTRSEFANISNLSIWELLDLTVSRRDDLFRLADMLVNLCETEQSDNTFLFGSLTMKNWKENREFSASIPMVLKEFYGYAMVLQFEEVPQYDTWIKRFQFAIQAITESTNAESM